MLEEWKRTVDQGKVFSDGPAETFSCLLYEILIAKLNAYGFSLPA